jgi:hypothetical protein
MCCRWDELLRHSCELSLDLKPLVYCSQRATYSLLKISQAEKFILKVNGKYVKKITNKV